MKITEKLFYVPRESFENLNLKAYAAALRINVLYMIQRAGSGHIGGTFSSLDILNYLYHCELRPEDIYITSKGHDCAGLYAMLISKGLLSESYLHDYRQPGGLEGHPDISTTEIITNTGSLGMGLSKAQGLALANRLKGTPGQIFVMLGDGEMQEGQNWEALRNIAFRGITEIVPIIDNNGFQCNWSLRETSDYYNLPGMLDAAGWATFFVDGHDYESLESVFNKIREKTTTTPKKPCILIARTKKGRGGGIMEDNNIFHSGAPTYSDYLQAANRLIRLLPEGQEAGVFEENEFDSDEREKIINKNNIHEYGRALLDAMKKNEKIVCLDADLCKDCGLEDIRQNFPDRFFEFGISEQDMVSAAGGLALAGYIPVVHSFAAFLCRRANEQIYNTCTEDTKIIYVGSLAGELPPGPGLSHTCINDRLIMLNMPGMVMFVPGWEGLTVKSALEKSLAIDGPAYISLAAK